jgi:hypothetical protein
MARENRITEVHLHERSTPYDFKVKMSIEGRMLGLYDGTSYKSALSAYWQAVNTLAFAGPSAIVEMDLTVERQPHGGFRTEIARGQKLSLHVPHGQCSRWAYKAWSRDNLPEQIIATIPGMLRPVRYPRK